MPMESSSSLPTDLQFRDSIDDETTEDTEADTLVRGSSFPSASLNQKRRRRGGSKTAAFAPRPCRQQSFGREIGHAAAETYLLTRLSFRLLSYLGYHTKFIVSFPFLFNCSVFNAFEQLTIWQIVEFEFGCRIWTILQCFKFFFFYWPNNDSNTFVPSLVTIIHLN